MDKIPFFTDPTFKASSGESTAVPRYDLLRSGQATPDAALKEVTLTLKNQNTTGTPINAASLNGIVTAVNGHMDEQASASAFGHAKASSTAPKANGTASVGTEVAFARGDHVHPLQTTVSGNAGSATKLQTARNIGNASFDGSANITLAQMGAAGTATATTSANGLMSSGDKVKLDGIANYTHPNSTVTPGTYNSVTVNAQGHVTAGTNGTTVPGNIETATRLQTARTINGTPFDGSSNITFGRYFAPAIQANENLNNYTNEGFYYCPANATVATLTNCPTANAFSLQVTRHAGVHQRLVEYMATGSPRIYFRNYYSGTWMAWAREYSTLDKPTAADIGAVPTSHASTATTYGVSNAANYGHAMASSATPLVAGTAAVGTDNGKFAREGHVHPAQASVSGNAGTATTLATARNFRTNLTSTSTASFNGSADCNPGVTGVLGVSNGGTGATDAVAALANLGLRMAWGNLSVTFVNGVGTTDVIFPSGRFTATPKVYVSLRTTRPDLSWVSSWGQSATGFTIYHYRNAAETNMTVYWLAIQ